MSIAERLKECRKYLDVTQSEFAEKLSLKWDKIKNIETNKHKLTPELANKIEQIYSISGWWLLTGKGNMTETNSNSQIESTEKIKEYFETVKKRDLGNILHHIMDNVLIENQFGLSNRNQLYFMGLNEKQINKIENIASSYLTNLDKRFLVVNCKNLTIGQILRKILEDLNIPIVDKSNSGLYEHVQELLYFENIVIIFKELSKSKTPKIESYFRGFIKTLDDAHFKNIAPSSNIIFIDYPSFLEKHQEYIGIYLNTNLIAYSTLE